MQSCLMFCLCVAALAAQTTRPESRPDSRPLDTAIPRIVVLEAHGRIALAAVQTRLELMKRYRAEYDESYGDQRRELYHQKMLALAAVNDRETERVRKDDAERRQLVESVNAVAPEEMAEWYRRHGVKLDVEGWYAYAPDSVLYEFEGDDIWSAVELYPLHVVYVGDRAQTPKLVRITRGVVDAFGEPVREIDPVTSDATLAVVWPQLLSMTVFGPVRTAAVAGILQPQHPGKATVQKFRVAR